MLSKELYSLLLKYEEYIDLGNTILKQEFNTEISPLLAKRRGIIPQKGVIRSRKLTFRFHGMGCYFNFDGLIVDFDYSLGDFIYKGFDLVKFNQFVKSNIGTSELLKDNNVYVGVLNELLDQGFIAERNLDSSDTYQYVRV